MGARKNTNTKKSRPQKITRIARKRAQRAERLRESNGITRKPLKRKAVNSRLREIIAYDLETTSIKAGTPKPLYLTAYGADLSVSVAVNGIDHLGELLRERLLVDEYRNARFVAWNGNGYDVFFVAAALLHFPEYELRPYLTRSKSLRGLRVIDKRDRRRKWEFLDGIAMTGIVGKTLKSFIEIFAPEYGKLEGPNFDTEQFNADNEKHRRYAERDSEGLFHAMQRAQSIVYENLGVPLNPTIGNTGIKIFSRNIPEGVQCWPCANSVVKLIRDYVMRGGFCYCARRYEGPVWKYDINQAYAAAMRDCWLPSGRCMHVRVYDRLHICGIWRVTARKRDNRIPFYYRTLDKRSVFGIDGIDETWLTSVEIDQLRAEKWDLTIHEGYAWDSQFRMQEYVDKLESLRMNAPGGPSGAQGSMIKAIGNNSYGKTVETLDGIELIFSAEKPEGFHEYQVEDDTLRHVFFRFNDPVPREYHLPQIGAFITAHVRMEVRRAALQNVKAWLYADTDCVIFSEPCELNLDAKRYGFWKQEAAGESYRIIAKKVYADFGAVVKHAKGMNVKRLTATDFDRWYRGEAPIQQQLHRNNFLKVMTGFDMFVSRSRVGEIIDTKREKR